MAGTAPDGRLSAGPRAIRRGDGAADGGAADFAVAVPADEAELRALLRATPTTGAVSLAFTREPDYFRGEGAGGARDTTIVARQAGRVVCLGRCSRRAMYLDGVAREAGYLGELRLAPWARRGLAVLRKGYAFFARCEAARPADIYFTSIAADNSRARAVLESGRLGLPCYRPWAELSTLVWPVSRRGPLARTGREGADEVERAGDAGELCDFLDREARRRALTTPWSPERLAALDEHGLRPDDFWVLRRAGRIVAAAGLWDQAAWRQTRVAAYSPALRRVRPWANLFARLRGRPVLPTEGAVLRRASLHPLAVADGEGAALPALWRGLEREAARRGLDWLTLSLDAREQSILGTLPRQAGTRLYATRLYTVGLPGLASAAIEPSAAWVRPEAAWL